MRTSLLNLDQATAAAPAEEPAQRFETTSSPAAAAPAAEEPVENLDFEIVMGRRQIASTSLLMIVALACFSGVSYLIGKSAVSKPAVAASAPAPVAAIRTVANKSEPVPPAPAVTASADHSAVFAEAETGKVYIQVGAIEKGLAGVWAEGLRTHGLPAFVSTGPSDKMWRVLIGPLPAPQDYQQAKNTLDSLGISTFGRRYTEQQAPQHSTSAPVTDSPVAP